MAEGKGERGGDKGGGKGAAGSNLGITPRGESYADWYQDLVLKAELADYSPVRGCMVVRPYGWALWENIRATFDRFFAETCHVNAQFPLFIPLRSGQRGVPNRPSGAPPSRCRWTWKTVCPPWPLQFITTR